MLANFVLATYIVAGLLFIFALAGLSRFETSKRGNAFGILGMVLAVVATIIAVWAPESWHGSDWATRMPSFIGDAGLASVGLLVAAMLVGAVIGTFKAVRVEMTGMPQLIAQLHSFVGLAAVLIGFNAFIETDGALRAGYPQTDLAFHLAEDPGCRVDRSDDPDAAPALLAATRDTLTWRLRNTRGPLVNRLAR